MFKVLDTTTFWIWIVYFWKNGRECEYYLCNFTAPQKSQAQDTQKKILTKDLTHDAKKEQIVTLCNEIAGYEQEEQW